MLVFRYEKGGAAIFLSHLDVMRHIMRTLRRAEIPVRYSEGFNPHMQIRMTPPLPLGLASRAEYCTVDTALPAADFLPRFAACAPDFLRPVAAWDVEKDPNLAGATRCAEYEIRLEGLAAHEREVLSILDGDRFDIEYFDRGGQRVTDVRSKILDLRFADGALVARLAAGNDNLRADRFAYNLARLFDLVSATLTVEKTRHFIARGDEVLTVDEALAGPVR